jgi:hypothetical protein
LELDGPCNLTDTSVKIVPFKLQGRTTEK